MCKRSDLHLMSSIITDIIFALQVIHQKFGGMSILLGFAIHRRLAALLQPKNIAKSHYVWIDNRNVDYLRVLPGRKYVKV